MKSNQKTSTKKSLKNAIIIYGSIVALSFLGFCIYYSLDEYYSSLSYIIFAIMLAGAFTIFLILKCINSFINKKTSLALILLLVTICLSFVLYFIYSGVIVGAELCTANDSSSTPITGYLNCTEFNYQYLSITLIFSTIIGLFSFLCIKKAQELSKLNSKKIKK